MKSTIFRAHLLCCESFAAWSRTAAQAESRGKACFDYAEAQPALAAEQQQYAPAPRKARASYLRSKNDYFLRRRHLLRCEPFAEQQILAAGNRGEDLL